MYATGNPTTKRALRERIARARAYEADPIGAPRATYPGIWSPGPFPAPENGRATVEGPHFPAPHRWYATVTVRNGLIVDAK